MLEVDFGHDTLFVKATEEAPSIEVDSLKFFWFFSVLGLEPGAYTV